MTITVVSSATEITVDADGVVTKYDATQYKVTIERGNAIVVESRPAEIDMSTLELVVEKHLPTIITFVLTYYPELTDKNLSDEVAKAKWAVSQTYPDISEETIDLVLAKIQAKFIAAFTARRVQNEALLQMALRR